MLFTRHQPHPDGPVIRVRHARSGDRIALDALLRDRAQATELQAARLLRHDPRVHLVLCATSWVDGHERVVGFASRPLVAGTGPELLVSDEERAAGTAEALRTAVAERLELAARVA